MTERAVPAQLAEDSEATLSMPSYPQGEEGTAPLLPIEPPLAGDLVTVSKGDTEKDPRVELGQLRRAMETRPVIDMARGILMASFGLSADDAWSVLVSISQHTNTKLHLVAGELVSAVTGGTIPKAFRQQVATTIAQLEVARAAANDEPEGRR
ncbi:ANTAR domain-containing protein [Streptomyces sp. Je 1-332]|uniref:ANTAR domain-containing protein n=1 Tax=Streptomyces sp. Je 1-332 TaxID=3231270 RepID=UPI0034596E08